MGYKLESAERVFIAFPDKHPSASGVDVIQSDNTTLKMAPDVDDAECFPWMPIRRPNKVNRLEIRAALNMSVNILPFWLCTFPVSCNIMALYWCVRLEGDVCDVIDSGWPYLWNLFMLHTVYNPAMYMFTSFEFRRALPRVTKKFINIFHIQIKE